MTAGGDYGAAYYPQQQDPWSAAPRPAAPYSAPAPHPGYGTPAPQPGYYGNAAAYPPQLPAGYPIPPVPGYYYGAGYPAYPQRRPNSGLSTALYVSSILLTIGSCGLLSPFMVIGGIIDLVLAKKSGRETGVIWTMTIINGVIAFIWIAIFLFLAIAPSFL